MKSDLIEKAYEFAAKVHQGQKRKYTGEDYIFHPLSVAEIVKSVGGSESMYVAALLHDTVEDTKHEPPHIVRHAIEFFFGKEVRNLVDELTDQYTPEAYPRFNREQRKAYECKRIAVISRDAQTIKLADLIDNTSSIVKHDPSFAAVYLKEKKALLKVLGRGNPILYERACRVYKNAIRVLNVNGYPKEYIKPEEAMTDVTLKEQSQIDFINNLLACLKKDPTAVERHLNYNNTEEYLYELLEKDGSVLSGLISAIENYLGK